MTKKDRTELVVILDGLLQLNEPRWQTNSMSLWNRARRARAKLKDGVEISPALSWNAADQTWVL